jgi:hypothetical protein
MLLLPQAPPPASAALAAPVAIEIRADSAASTSPAAAAPLALALAPAAWLAELEPWAAARRGELRIEIAALEDVCAANTGRDAPERIKQHLYRAYRERGARYALLVGDADVFPVRYMALDRVTPAAFDWAFYPCDLYYADVAEPDGAFDDWNASNDSFHAGYWGEVCGEKNKDGAIDRDGVSYAPELGVGRWPVSTREQLAAVVAKTLAWKPAPAPRALLVHADGWIDARGRYDQLASTLDGAGYIVDAQLYGRMPNVPNPTSVRASFEQPVLVALHAGHGSPAGFEGCFGATEEQALSQLAAGIVFSAGCSTAHWAPEPPYQAYVDVHGVPHRGTNAGEVFAEPPPAPAALQGGVQAEESLGERLARAPRGGPVVYIGCATGSQPCALTLQEGFVRALVEPENDSSLSPTTPRVGDAWRRALAHYVEAEHLRELVPTADWYPPSIYFQGMKFVLFGDPTLPLPQPARRP